MARLAKLSPLASKADLLRLEEHGALYLVSPYTYHQDLVTAKSVATGETFTLYKTLMEFVEDGPQLP